MRALQRPHSNQLLNTLHGSGARFGLISFLKAPFSSKIADCDGVPSPFLGTAVQGQGNAERLPNCSATRAPSTAAALRAAHFIVERRPICSAGARLRMDPFHHLLEFDVCRRRCPCGELCAHPPCLCEPTRLAMFSHNKNSFNDFLNGLTCHQPRRPV